MSISNRDLQRVNVSENITIDGKTFLSDGTESLPSMTFTSDTNTGIFCPNLNNISISTDGTQRMTINQNGEVGVGIAPVSDYRLTLYNATGKNGLNIRSGDALGDIALHVSDQDNTFTQMEIESDIGYTTFGKTYAQTLSDNGVVHGVDNQNSGSASDINTQTGIYRIGGVDVVDVAQSLTNKTITSSTNNVAANSLKTTGASVTVSTASAPTTGQILTATSGTAANWQTPSGITNSIVSSLTETSTTSTSYVVLNSMTTTPASGTYFVSFSSSGASSITSNTANYAIFNNGTIVSNSERFYGEGGGAQTNNLYTAMHSQSIVTVNGSQAIDVRYKIAQGAFSIRNRSMILLKLS